MRLYWSWIKLAVITVLLLMLPLDGKYDKYFQKYSKWYFGYNFDWRLFKAQAIQESRLDSIAISYVGARGIMQFMPGTWSDIEYELFGKDTDINVAKYNIHAGIYYDRKLWNIWSAPRPYIERIRFMLGSYNAGVGNILKAQKLAVKDSLNYNYWYSIKRKLPDITGRHSKETIHYVDRIIKLWWMK
jgi:membrane-bound lytic murein transglycosylase MltF